MNRTGAAVLGGLDGLSDDSFKNLLQRHQCSVSGALTDRVAYAGQIRQIGVTDLGRQQPTLFLTNNTETTVRELVINHARRNGIEDALGSSVNFFHQDCSSSEVSLNVDLDTVLTVLANGCYRWLASQLHGFDLSKPKCVYRKFVETSGAVEIEDLPQSPGWAIAGWNSNSHNSRKSVISKLAAEIRVQRQVAGVGVLREAFPGGAARRRRRLRLCVKQFS